MAIKNILVHVSDDPRSSTRLELAIALARVHEAHLTALYVIPSLQFPGYVLPQIPAEILADQRRNTIEEAERAKAVFLEATDREGVLSEWRTVEDVPKNNTELHARCADLVVVGQRDPEMALGSFYDLAEQLVMTAGRPVLVVPYAGQFKTVGERVLLGWDGTREATRAVHDALPILVRAQEAVVFCVNPPDRGRTAGADMTAHLARHGVKAEARHTITSDLEVGDALLSAAADFGSDLLVMGAYGHSRVRELVLGGATRHILQHMTIPVLMSH